MSDDVAITIERVEQLYRAITGKATPPEEPAYAPIPPERDPQQFVEQQLDKLLMVLGASGVRAVAHRPAWTPPISVWDRTDELLVCVDVPGVDKETIEIERLGPWLSVNGRREPRVDGVDARPAQLEAPAGDFLRLIPLPQTAAFGRATAELKQGVLEIHLPRAGGAMESRWTIAVA